ncbi:MAG: hypothetical protein AAFP99_07160 [Pseudomonadota bacterium]
MKPVLNTIAASSAAIALAVGSASAANVSNNSAQQITLVVTENGNRGEVILAVGQTQALCPTGCFITLPGGDRIVLSGGETVTITDGKALIE